MFDLFLFFVYFIYGLAFLVMGLTLALEASRSADASERQALLPLVVFGLLHGIHEWLESYLLQAATLGVRLPDWLPWLRVILLASSFLSLGLFAVGTFRQPGYSPLVGMRWGLALILPFSLGILLSTFLAYREAAVPWPALLDGLSRYLLAIPGAFTAALAFRSRSVRAAGKTKPRLARGYLLAAIGFGLYGLTQLFVNPLDLFPASLLNTETFRALTGFPVQILRALAAVLITLNILRATQLIEQDRQAELVSAREERLQALEQIKAELTKREQLRRELLQHTVFCQEEERARIARELHDETSQVLSAVGLDLATLKTLLMKNDPALDLVERLQLLSKQMAHGLYRLVHDLRPAQLDDLGLIPALQYLSEQDAGAKGLDIRLQVEGNQRRLEPAIETVLFRVAQEALSNILRHARTPKGSICLRYGKQEAILTIADQGVGFDTQRSFLPPRGWGLAGMQERLEAVGGQLVVQSVPGHGTTIIASIPLFDLLP